jgi:hypothetical protein
MKKAYLFLNKHGITISFIFGTILSVISIAAVVFGFPEGATMEDLYKTSIFDPALNISFALIAVASLAAVVGPAIYTAFNFKDSIKFLILFVALLLMYIISVAMGATPNKDELIFFQGVDNQHLTADTVAYIDGLLKFTSIMIFLTLGSLVFSGVWGIIKQR